MKPVKIKRHVVAGIENHAQACSPHECCGLLSGPGEVIEQLHRLTNIAQTPQTRYFAEPGELVQAHRLIRLRGERLMGIYHSHPRSPAYPSPIDVEQAYYPDVVYFIIALDPTPELRAYKIVEGQVEEINFHIVDD